MRKTYIHKILSEIVSAAKTAKIVSDNEPMYTYNSSSNKKRILAANDKIAKLCSELVSEVFS